MISINMEPNGGQQCSITVDHQWERNLFSQAQALTLTPLCFDKLSLLKTQRNNSSCGEEPADVRREGGGLEWARSIRRVGDVIYLPLCVM